MTKTKWEDDLESPIRGLAFSSDSKRLFVGTTSEELPVYSASAGKHERSYHGKGWGLVLRTSPDGRHLLSAGENGILALHPLGGGPPREWKGHDDWVAGIAWTPDSSLVATAGYDSSIRVWNPSSETAVRELKKHVGGVRALAFSPSGQHLVSGGYDQGVRQWETGTWELCATIYSHASQVTALAFFPQGDALVVAGGQGVCRLAFPVGKASKPTLLPAHSAAITALALHPDGKRLFCGGEDGKVAEWNPVTGVLTGPVATTQGEVAAIAVSPDGRLLACGAKRRLVVLALGA